MLQENVEETLAEETPVQEESEEENQTEVAEKLDLESRLAELQKQVESERDARQKFEDKAKDLGAQLTRTQQDYSELNRFMKSQLPIINKAKSFDEEWEASPEQAVKTAAKSQVDPILQEMHELKSGYQYTQAELNLNSIMLNDPNLRKYENTVRELGNEYPEFTRTKQGIEKLFRIARAEDPEYANQVETQRVTQRAEMEKGRAYTESSSPKKEPTKKVVLSRQERHVAESLGLTHEQYSAQLERIRGNVKR